MRQIKTVEVSDSISFALERRFVHEKNIVYIDYRFFSSRLYR